MFNNNQIVYKKEVKTLQRVGITSIFIGVVFVLLMFVLSNPTGTGGIASGRNSDSIMIFLVLFACVPFGIGLMNLGKYNQFNAYFEATGAAQGTLEDVRKWKNGKDC